MILIGERCGSLCTPLLGLTPFLGYSRRSRPHIPGSNASRGLQGRGPGGMRVVVQNPFPDLERVCISGHHGRSRFVAYCTREPAHTRTRSTRSLRTALPLTPPSPIRISKGCLLTPPAIRTRRRIARASSQASCTESCTRQPSPTTQPTPS